MGKKRMKPKGKSGRNKAESGTASRDLAVAMFVVLLLLLLMWWVSNLDSLGS